jgi:hypothetical protein
MAYEETLKSISLDADSSLAVYTGVPGLPGSANPNYGKQYTFVKVSGAHQVGLATAAADDIVGVLQNKPQVTGMAATVGISGVTNVISGGTVTAGQKVASNATGQAITYATGTVCGVALTSSTGSGQLISVLLRVN